MNKIELFPKSTLGISKHNRRAVSDIVAVLILIVIAIVGAVAVALILNSTSHSVQQQAQGAGNGAQGKPTLYIGGSTTLYPATLAIGQTWGAANGVNVNVQQGGSSTGMVALHQGVIDIGESSDLGAVKTAQLNYPNDNLQAVEVGGSGVVVITHSTDASGLLLSSAGKPCQTITRAALTKIYTGAGGGLTSGVFYIQTGGCDPATNVLAQPILDASCIVPSAATALAAGVCNTLASATAAGPYNVYSRSDAGGTSDNFAKFIGVSNQAGITNFVGKVGNAGNLAAVQGDTASLGYVDIGFAETSTFSTNGNLAIPGVASAAPTALPGVWGVGCKADGTGAAQIAAGSSYDNCYVALGTSTKELHNAILNGLKSFTIAPSNSVFPDNGAKAAPLSRTFYLVTKGPAVGLAESFILYASGPDQVHFWTDQGYFSVYQFS